MTAAELAPARRARRLSGLLLGLAVLAVIILFVLKPWRPSSAEFIRADQHGYASCQAFEESIHSGGKTARDLMSRAWDEGRQSTTPALREVWAGPERGGPAQPRAGDWSDVKRECTQAGLPIND